jgi:DNA-binding LacI/PurR family transcriptional regulator
LHEAGLEADPDLQVDAITTERSGYEAANRLMERKAAFDALFCASDLIAIGAMRALQEKGFAIPRDAVIAGFDDIPVASFTNPSLTTVQQDTKTAANLLVETLLALIQGETVQSTTISAPVVIRQSTRR